jgi:hypothetical protein
MKRNENKAEILVYGEETIPFLRHIIDGLTDNSIISTSYAIDFSKLKKLKIRIKKKHEAPYVKCTIKYAGKNDILIDPIEQGASVRDKPDHQLSLE